MATPEEQQRLLRQGLPVFDPNGFNTPGGQWFNGQAAPTGVPQPGFFERLVSGPHRSMNVGAAPAPSAPAQVVAVAPAPVVPVQAKQAVPQMALKNLPALANANTAGAARGAVGSEAPPQAPVVPPTGAPNGFSPMDMARIQADAAANGIARPQIAYQQPTLEVDQPALQGAIARGNAQDLGGGIVAMAGTGEKGTYPIAWNSMGNMNPMRNGDIQIIRGNESSYATPEMGYDSPIRSDVYHASMANSGGMGFAQQLAADQLRDQATPNLARANAEIESARLRSAADIAGHGIAAEAARYGHEVQARTAHEALMGTPVQGGGELATLPGFPVPVPVPTFQRRIAMPNGGIDFAPMGAVADRKAAKAVPPAGTHVMTDHGPATSNGKNLVLDK